ncbi:hypothetical protein ScPMuIL_001347 [Solemya velum]
MKLNNEPNALKLESNLSVENQNLVYGVYLAPRARKLLVTKMSKLTKSSHISSQHFGVRNYCKEARKIDPIADRQFQLYYFDTLALTKKLQAGDFSVAQSEAVAQCFVEVIQGAFDHQGKNLVTKPQQEITVQQLMAHIAAVKKDMVILEKSEFSMLRSETEKQSLEIKQLKITLQDEISKLKGHVTLDINLERGRAVEAFGFIQYELEYALTDNFSSRKEHLRQIFSNFLKYSIGTVLTCATVCLGVIRLWS